ncbi:MAG: winged helix-turn-helix transcriptional regulator [Actinobacteria bacterium]|nr:winged helix-turn-helix transcriptional regulator [Actinomycetota bacterium]
MSKSERTIDGPGPLPFLAPLPGESRTAEVERQLKESIDLGLLPAGSRLPSEGDLAEQLGVSAMTLREALASLREQGLLVTRRGRAGGSFVQDPGAQQRSGAAALRAYSVNDLRDLLDHHGAIAAAIARLAAERAGASDLGRLQADNERFEAAAGAAERRRADARFHVDLAVASHSSRLTGEEVRFQGELSGPLWLPRGADPDPAGHAAGHAAVLAALERRSPEAAGAAAETAAKRAAERLLARRLEISA